jgi:hypothetical protein
MRNQVPTLFQKIMGQASEIMVPLSRGRVGERRAEVERSESHFLVIFGANVLRMGASLSGSG